MLHAHCGRVLKVRGRMGILKTIQRQVDFWDKGKAEENIYHLKEQREKLRALRAKMLEMEGSLDASINALQKATEITTKLKPLIQDKKDPKKR